MVEIDQTIIIHFAHCSHGPYSSCYSIYEDGINPIPIGRKKGDGVFLWPLLLNPLTTVHYYNGFYLLSHLSFLFYALYSRVFCSLIQQWVRN